MRKLVTIRRVDFIRSIPDADAIECATVEGWDIVIKKGEFTVGDFCVYFEIDSFLPLADERYSFLAKNKIKWNDKEGIRLRTIKLRGQISQGLILPLDSFPELKVQNGESLAKLRDVDYSATLAVEKWEAPIPAELAGEVEGPFPSFIAKTDQERIQNLTEVLSEQSDQSFEATIKLDGSSMTVFSNTDTSGVCGRNWWIKESESNSLWRVARQGRLLEALKACGRNLALQGEIVGEGIQGNPEQLRGQGFYVFDVFDIDKHAYLGREARTKVINDLVSLGATIAKVPFIEVTTLDRFHGDLNAVLAYAEGPSLNPQTKREGVVFKRLDGTFSFKAISNSYLLKHADR